jgi:hypothetical protein
MTLTYYSAVVSLTVSQVSTKKISKIFVGKAKVIPSAGTINTACTALNSGIQFFLNMSKEALVGKGLIDHAVLGVRFAKRLEPDQLPEHDPDPDLWHNDSDTPDSHHQ